MNDSTDRKEDRVVKAEHVSKSQDQKPSPQEDSRLMSGPTFNPPVRAQRYFLVQDVLKKHNVESVVDFGCAQCKVVYFLKSVGTVRRIALVDVDRSVIEGRREVISPDMFEWRICKRRNPLSVFLFHGSAGDMDGRIAGYQAATLVELIEHLQPDVLSQVTYNVFGRLRPAVVVVTTPNADFNVLFPDFNGFRHWDHKFEWSRAEFEQWCDQVCQQHGYAVEYTGVGDPPPEMSHVGFCTQAAIFTEISGKAGEQTEEKVYELVEEVVYPVDERTPTERLASEAQYLVRFLSNVDDYRSEDDTQAVIPTSLVTRRVLEKQTDPSEEKWTEDDVLEYLRSNYTLTDDEMNIVVQLDVDDSCPSSDEDTCEDVEQSSHEQTEGYPVCKEEWCP